MRSVGREGGRTGKCLEVPEREREMPGKCLEVPEREMPGKCLEVPEREKCLGNALRSQRYKCWGNALGSQREIKGGSLIGAASPQTGRRTAGWTHPPGLVPKSSRNRPDLVFPLRPISGLVSLFDQSAGALPPAGFRGKIGGGESSSRALGPPRGRGGIFSSLFREQPRRGLAYPASSRGRGAF